MASRRPSPAPRRIQAIKRADGEPLTRADIQYDVLHYIFQDNHNVFTDPYSSSAGLSSRPKLCFRDLYIKAIMNSPKATKALKDKMSESSIFAEDFGMLALLVNVGRINTTMSFFPEMKTAIRTYHPIAALQRTNGNLQDAPRIKNILKTSLLEDELNSAPTTPADLLSRVKEGHIPSTSITNLIFILTNHSGPIGQAHLSEGLDFADLFIRPNVSSETRGRAFLWLCFNYLENSSTADEDDYDNEGIPNPFGDPRRDKMPSFVMLNPAEALLENVDSEGEKNLAEQLVAQRIQIVKTQGPKDTNKSSSRASVSGSVIGDDDEQQLVLSSDEAKGKRGVGKGEKGKRTLSSSAKEKKSVADKARRERMKQKVKERDMVRHAADASISDDDYDTAVPRNRAPTAVHMQQQYPSHRRRESPRPILPQNAAQPRLISRGSSNPTLDSRRHRYAPYERSPVPADSYMLKEGSRYSHHSLSKPPKSMLEHAWHIVTTRDPLMDSDDELGDEHDRWDYIQRLKVISRLRGKEPTPEPESIQLQMNTDTPLHLIRGAV